MVVYKVGSFFDLSVGPMVSDTSQLGKVSIVAVHPIQTNAGQLYRVQGVALPKRFMVSSLQPTFTQVFT